MHKNIAKAVILASVAGLLSACSVSAQAGPAPVASSHAPDTDAPAADTSSLIVKLGQTVKYEDGLEVVIKSSGNGIADQYAAPVSVASKPYQEFTMTVKNGTKDTFDANGVYVTAVKGAEGTKVETVIDMHKGLQGPILQGQMVPGGTQTVKFGMSMLAKDLPSLVFTVRPSYKYEDAVVKGS